MTITGPLLLRRCWKTNNTYSQNKRKDSRSKNTLRGLDTTAGSVGWALCWLLLRSREGAGWTEHSFVTMCPGRATQAWALNDCSKWQATRTPPHHMVITTAISASKTQNHTQRCAHKHIHAHMQPHPHAHKHTYMYLHTQSQLTYMCAHTYTRMHTNTHTHTYTDQIISVLCTKLPSVDSKSSQTVLTISRFG